MSKLATNYVQGYDKGTALFVQGDPASTLYFILDGTIITSQDGEHVTLGSGGVLGDVAFFQETVHFYAAICASNVTVIEINKENIVDVLTNQARIACALLRELAVQITNPTMVFLQGVQREAEKSVSSSTQVLPEGHPVFKERVDAVHSEYLFPTEVECPVCQTNFTGMRTRTSRLQMLEPLPDFRLMYRDFEPNFYYIWVCPQCSFAYPERQYNKVSRTALQRGEAAWRENPSELNFAFDGQRTLEQVITSYYLALRTFEIVGATPEQWANLWLRLVWIYEDLEEKDLMKKAAQNSYEYFEEAMSKTVRSAAGDQQLYIILGELGLRLNKGGEAFRNFHSAAIMTGGDPRYKRMAADRIQDLRDRRSR